MCAANTKLTTETDDDSLPGLVLLPETRPQGQTVTGGEMPHLAPCRIMLETAVTLISAPNMANLVRLNNNWPEQKVTETV